MSMKSSLIAVSSVVFIVLLLSPSLVTVASSAGSSQSFSPFGATTVFHLTPARGKVGRNVTVTGQRFPASTPYTIKFGSVVVRTGTISTTGVFSTYIIVPQAPAKSNTVTVTAGKSLVTRDFTVIPRIIITPKTAVYGSVIKIVGYGFASNSAVTATFASITMMSTGGSVNTNSSGTFVGYYIIPDVAPGKYTITASDNTGNSASAPFTEAR
jgi:hypothetical protein